MVHIEPETNNKFVSLIDAAMSNFLQPDSIEAIALLIREFGEHVGAYNQRHGGRRLLQDGAAASPTVFNLYTLVRGLHAANLLWKLNPILGRYGLDASILPQLTHFGVNTKPLISWAFTRYAKPSLKLDTRNETDTAEYLVRWAAQHNIKKATTGGKERETILTERVRRKGKERSTTFNVVRSNVEDWTVEWKGRTFFISKLRREDPPKSESHPGYGDLMSSRDRRDALHGDRFARMIASDPYYASLQDENRDSSLIGVEYILIECYGTDNGPCHDLLNHCKAEMLATERKDAKVKLINMTAEGWEETQVPGRPIDTLDCPDGLRKTLVDDALSFFDPRMQGWSDNNGSNWRRGYQFYGPPGTGKSSFALALATHLSIPIYTVSLLGMSEQGLKDCFNDLPNDGCMLLLEDLDSAGLIADTSNTRGRKRESDEDDGENSEESGEGGASNEHGMFGGAHPGVMPDAAQPGSLFGGGQPGGMFGGGHPGGMFGGGQPGSMFGKPHAARSRRNLRPPRPGGAYGSMPQSGITVSTLINLIDGIGAKSGRLLVITTNRISSIDERILRPGRISRPFHFFGYATKETAAMTYKRMFGSYPIDPPTGTRLERMAKAFGDQCPTNFITTSEI